jgi:hypothetical protein
MNLNDNTFWKNAYGQIRNFWSTIGLAIALAVCEYLLENSEWTWRAALVAGVGAFVKYFATRDDHKKTRKAVGEAVIKTQEILEAGGKDDGGNS